MTAAPHAAPAAAPDLLVSRQPILDLKQELAGYELRFRSAGALAATAAGQLHATASVVCAAFAELGLSGALGPHRAFIKADERFIMEDVVGLLPAASVILELDFAAAPDATLLTRCRALRAEGYTLALAGYDGPDLRAEALLPLVGIVKIDAQATPAKLAELVATLTPLPLRILADQVETREQMEHCRDLGCHLFQGYYFARPKMISGHQLSASQLSIIRLLNLVAREADSVDLEESFKREPALTVNLLRLVNAVGSGVTHKVDSLRHAIAILGRKQLLRWLQLLLMASPDSGAPERSPLLLLAAQRGRLLELLAERSRSDKRGRGDEAFLAGVMSLMPAALGLPIDDILEQIPVVDSVRDALARHEGQLGQMLALAEHLDDNDWARCDALLSELAPLSCETLSGSLSEALAWIHGERQSD